MTPSTRHTPPPGFGAALVAARAAAGLGVRETARRAGITPGYLCMLQAGQRSPSRAVAAALAAVLGLDGQARAVLAGGAVPGVGYDHPRKAGRLERRAGPRHPRLTPVRASEQRQRARLDLGLPPALTATGQRRVGGSLGR